MGAGERLIAGSLTLLLLVIWLGFWIHVDPRFPGSVPGVALGAAGAALMLVPYWYSVVKRTAALRKWVERRMSIGSFLTVHIYAGIAGAVLGMLHTGHRFQSPIGIALTALMLVIVLSGVIGRYLWGYLSDELREKKSLLDRLEQRYRALALELESTADGAPIVRFMARPFVRLIAPLLLPRPERSALFVAGEVLDVTQSMADVEYAIKGSETIRRIFGYWLRLHLVLSCVFLALLIAHIGVSLAYGLGWRA